MTTEASQILEDPTESLRSTNVFRRVTLGEAPAATETPRADVICDGQEAFQPDDSAAGRWMRLRASIVIHMRSSDSREAIERFDELCRTAVDAIVTDPYRNQLCGDLPIGRATEVGRIEPVRGLKRPHLEATISVRCHFELTEGN